MLKKAIPVFLLTLLMVTSAFAQTEPVEAVNQGPFRWMERQRTLALTTMPNTINNKSISSAAIEAGEEVTRWVDNPNVFCNTTADDGGALEECIAQEADINKAVSQSGRRAQIGHATNTFKDHKQLVETEIWHKNFQDVGLKSQPYLDIAAGMITEPALQTAAVWRKQEIDRNEENIRDAYKLSIQTLDLGSQDGEASRALVACTTRAIADGKGLADAYLTCVGGNDEDAEKIVAAPKDEIANYKDLPHHPTKTGWDSPIREELGDGTKQHATEEGTYYLTDLLFSEESANPLVFTANGSEGSGADAVELFKNARSQFRALVGDVEFTLEAAKDKDAAVNNRGQASQSALSRMTTMRGVDPYINLEGTNYRAGSSWYFRHLFRNAHIKLNSFFHNMCVFHNDSVNMLKNQRDEFDRQWMMTTNQNCGTNPEMFFDNEKYLTVLPSGSGNGGTKLSSAGSDTDGKLNLSSEGVGSGTCGSSTAPLHAVTVTDLSYPGFTFGKRTALAVYELFLEEERQMRIAREKGGGIDSEYDSNRGKKLYELNCDRLNPYGGGGSLGSGVKYNQESSFESATALASEAIGSGNNAYKAYRGRFASVRLAVTNILAIRIASGQLLATFQDMLDFLATTSHARLRPQHTGALFEMLRGAVRTDNIGQDINRNSFEIGKIVALVEDEVARARRLRGE